ncbi:alpha/beta fold hydrolase [Hydrogenophaga sp.]|uniref:alpha/beta fold hydrolase n=1 Tax=Hydrogenophaga sp. TaxID=1904254 RepID=UPI002FC898FF
MTNLTFGASTTGSVQRRDWLKLMAVAGSAAGAAALPLPASAAAGPVWVPAEMPNPAPTLEGTVDVGGAKLWYWDTGGNGQPVIFMHAGSQSGAGWGYQQPVFAAAGYRAIGYSRRGYFRSESGNPQEPGAAFEDLNQLIEHLKLDKVHLVAIAHGAFFALDFALVYPHKLRSLTIASSYLGIADSEKDYLEANRRLRPKEFNALPVEVKELHPSYRAGNPEGVAAWVKLSKEASVGPRISAKRPHELTWERLESIKTPTLLMTGDGDLYTPPALLRMQASHMPHAEAVIVPEAGHCANWEQPAVFNRTVLAFLRRHAT